MLDSGKGSEKMADAGDEIASDVKDHKLYLDDIVAKDDKCSCVRVRAAADHLLKRYSSKARVYFGVEQPDPVVYLPYLTPQHAVAGDLEMFEMDIQCLIDYASSRIGGKICQGCEEGDRQRQKEKEEFTKKVIQELKARVESLKSELADPLKQVDIEIRRAGRILGVLKREKDSWLAEQDYDMEDWVARTPKSDSETEINGLKEEVRRLKLSLEGPGARMSGVIGTVQAELNKLEGNKRKWLVEKGLEEEEVVWFA